MLNSGDRLDQTASYLPDPANTTQAILGLLSERLRGGSDSDGARTESTLVAGLRSVPGVLQAELRPADSTPPSGGELLWPAGPGRLLAVTLRDGYNSHGVPEALACLAATLDVTWRRDAEAHTGPLSRDTALATAKTEFIATVIHDLATPITPILAYAGLLADPDTGPLTTDQREFVKVIERNAMRLSELLNDLPLLVDPPRPSWSCGGNGWTRWSWCATSSASSGPEPSTPGSPCGSTPAPARRWPATRSASAACSTSC
nr:hypothetical protein GCM10020093_119160 [Planobispora longispora]